MILRLAALALLAQNSLALAQEEKANADANTPASDQSEADEASPYSASVDFKYRSDTKNERDNTYQRLFSLGASLGYDIKDVGSVGFSLRGNKELNNEQRYVLTDLSVDFGRSFTLIEGQEDGTGLKLGVNGGYGAPVSKDVIKYSNSKGDLSATTSLSYSFDGSLKGLRVNYGLTYGRYLYQYQDTNGGIFLTKWAFIQSYGASYSYDKYSASVNFSNTTPYDFRGNKQDDSFNHVESLGYRINEKWSATVGHTNDGATYDYGGKANNVKFYDKYNSQVFVGGAYQF